MSVCVVIAINHLALNVLIRIYAQLCCGRPFTAKVQLCTVHVQCNIQSASCSPAAPFGLLLSSSDQCVTALFTAKSESDRMQFARDLQECITEVRVQKLDSCSARIYSHLTYVLCHSHLCLMCVHKCVNACFSAHAHQSAAHQSTVFK